MKPYDDVMPFSNESSFDPYRVHRPGTIPGTIDAAEQIEKLMHHFRRYTALTTFVAGQFETHAHNQSGETMKLQSENRKERGGTIF